MEGSLRHRWSLIGLALVLWSALYAASAEARRIALVIGNGEYTKFDDLRNPANDARAMAGKLESLDFKLVGGQAHVNVNRTGYGYSVERLSRTN